MTISILDIEIATDLAKMMTRKVHRYLTKARYFDSASLREDMIAVFKGSGLTLKVAKCDELITLAKHFVHKFVSKQSVLSIGES